MCVVYMTIRDQYTPNDHHSLTLLSLGHLTQTPVKYTFSESLRIVVYKGIFVKIKKLWP